MKKHIITFSQLFLCSLLCAQAYFTGKLTDGKMNQQAIYYDRTENALSSSVFQSVYKIMDMQKKVLCTITATHHQNKSLILIALKGQDGSSREYNATYDQAYCGLIFSNKGNLDTLFPTSKSYDYLLSFTDKTLDFPVIHKVMSIYGNEIVLDPLSKLRIKNHNEIIKKLTSARADVTVKQVTPDSTIEQKEKARNDAFNTQLLQLQKQLYAKNSAFTETTTNIRKMIHLDVSANFKDRHIYSDLVEYEGEKRKGKRDGKGVLVDDGTVLDGFFEDGKFKSGIAHIHNKSYEYYGEFSDDSFNGTGWLKYENGNFVLGIFKNGKQVDGITLCKDGTGEAYFGCYKHNEKNGYGELRTATGNMYYGEFQNDRMVKGYSKEVDQFGYSTYMKIENGAKTSVEPQIAEKFFTLVYVLKE